MTPLIYLGAAVVFIVVATLVLWMRTRPRTPTMEEQVDSFRREREAMAPRRPPPGNPRRS